MSSWAWQSVVGPELVGASQALTDELFPSPEKQYKREQVQAERELLPLKTQVERQTLQRQLQTLSGTTRPIDKVLPDFKNNRLVFTYKDGGPPTVQPLPGDTETAGPKAPESIPYSDWRLQQLRKQWFAAQQGGPQLIPEDAAELRDRLASQRQNIPQPVPESGRLEVRQPPTLDELMRGPSGTPGTPGQGVPPPGQTPAQPTSQPPVSPSTDRPVATPAAGQWGTVPPERQTAILNATQAASQATGGKASVPDLLALQDVESSFNPWATSKDGAQGLGQLMPETQKRWGVKNPFDIKQNLQGSAQEWAVALDKAGGDPYRAYVEYYNPNDPNRFTAGRKLVALREQYQRLGSGASTGAPGTGTAPAPRAPLTFVRKLPPPETTPQMTQPAAPVPVSPTAGPGYAGKVAGEEAKGAGLPTEDRDKEAIAIRKYNRGELSGAVPFVPGTNRIDLRRLSTIDQEAIDTEYENVKKETRTKRAQAVIEQRTRGLNEQMQAIDDSEAITQDLLKLITPETVGPWANIRQFAQNLTAKVPMMAAAQLESVKKHFKDEAERGTVEPGLYDTRMDEIAFNMRVIAYAHARALRPTGVLRLSEVENAARSIEGAGTAPALASRLLANINTLKAKRGRLQKARGDIVKRLEGAGPEDLEKEESLGQDVQELRDLLGQ